MGERKKYSVSDSRIPAFTSFFRQEVEAFGGVTHFSELTSISRPTISFWYNGERTPDAESMIKLANFLNVNVDYLLGLSKVRNRDTTIQAVCEYTGLSEKSIQRLNSLKNQDDEEAVQVIDMLLDDEQEPLVENGRVSRSLINLIHFFIEYSGHEMPTKKVDVHGNITDYSQSRFVRSDTILLDDSIIENAILEELKQKLKAWKGARTDGEH